MDRTLDISAKIQILRPVQEVFEAIADPGKMTHYFISESTGRMEAGRSLIWRFPEFDMDVPVEVGKVVNGSLITYRWDNEGMKTEVEIQLTAVADTATIVEVKEGSMKNDERGIKWLKQNTEGWANFLCCLKGWVEYGINLRKGAFDFMRQAG